METIADKFERKIAEHIKNIEEQLEVIRKHLPEIDNASAIVCNNGEARIGLPLDPPSNKMAIEQLEEAGFTVGKQNLSDWGFGVYHSLIHKDYPTCRLDLAFFDFQDGATCKLQAIGKEKVERRIYEVVCNEGAEESK